jgi:hypothetical protein
MILSAPEMTINNGEAVLSARVSLQTPGLNKPERVWFAFPEKYRSFLSDRCDAFAAGLLPLAMALGEDMQVEGELSPRLARGMREYQLAFKFWFPDTLAEIAIQAPHPAVLSAGQAGSACLTLFSGGVDSSYTLMSHLPDRQPLPEFQARYALFVHGFDIPLQNRSSYADASRLFEQQLALQGVELIRCRTNLHYFTSGILKWDISHGGAVIAAGLALDKLVRYFLVPSSYALDELIPWGSTPMTDHWLSTETVDVIHHGVTFSRMEKVEAISHWEPAQHFLRVCVDEEHRAGVQNCSRCEKCLRTMTMLEICGVLKSFKTFRQPFGRGDILRWTPHYESGVVWLPQMVRFARTRRKFPYILPLRVAHLRGKIRLAARSLIPQFLFKHLKRQIFPYEKDPFNPVFLPAEDGSA